MIKFNCGCSRSTKTLYTRVLLLWSSRSTAFLRRLQRTLCQAIFVGIMLKDVLILPTGYLLLRVWMRWTANLLFSSAYKTSNHSKIFSIQKMSLPTLNAGNIKHSKWIGMHLSVNETRKRSSRIATELLDTHQFSIKLFSYLNFQLTKPWKCK